MESLNLKLFFWLNQGAGQQPVVDEVAVLFAESGPYLLMLALVVFWYMANDHRRHSLLEATEASIVGLLINQLLGLMIYHPRPYMVGLVEPLVAHAPENSFPSDHATLMFAAAFYLLMVRHWAACGIPLLTIAALTAWGRVYSGIHFPFDIMGSLLVGLVSIGLAGFIANPLKYINDRLIRTTDPLTRRLGQVIRRKNRDV